MCCAHDKRRRKVKRRKRKRRKRKRRRKVKRRRRKVKRRIFRAHLPGDSCFDPVPG